MEQNGTASVPHLHLPQTGHSYEGYQRFRLDGGLEPFPGQPFLSTQPPYPPFNASNSLHSTHTTGDTLTQRGPTFSTIQPTLSRPQEDLRLLPESQPTKGPTSDKPFSELSLAELWENKEVVNMYNREKGLIARLEVVLDENARLSRQVRQLEAELQSHIVSYPELPQSLRSAASTSTGRNGSVAPSDSISQQPSSTSLRTNTATNSIRTRPCLFQGAICDKAYDPAQLLWTRDDWRMRYKPSKNTAGRPPMDQILVYPDTLQVIEAPVWSAIRLTARELFHAHLAKLPVPASISNLQGRGGIGTKTYYEAHHLDAWNRTVQALEKQVPILTWCAAHWKAIAVISRIAQSHHKVQVEKGKSAGTEPAPTGDLESDPGLDSEEAEVPAPAAKPSKRSRKNTNHSARGGTSKRQRKDAAETVVSKVSAGASSASGATGGLPANSRLSVEVQLALGSLGAPPAAPAGPTWTNQSHTTTPINQIEPIPSTQTSLGLEARPQTSGRTSPEPQNQVPGPVPNPRKTINVSFIRPIEPTVEVLEDEFNSLLPNFKPVNELLKLLSAPSASPTTDASPEVLQWIADVNNADPNSPAFNEDTDEFQNNNGSQWGHYQFTAGGNGITRTLTSREKIGSPATALVLLAAFVRTAKVARFICRQHSISATTYLADVYIQELVEHLLKLWKPTAQEPAAGPQQEDQPPENSDLAALRTRLITASISTYFIEQTFTKSHRRRR
ncbi:hypothetical protein BKA70DRAFT_1317085 [Coprinopsis sp. MPI-PUGE-AT-0042]|nr:hypothetical protein BKA70DRAFT_1317085 [Coprinopsis sp. MPI-PUGE-AT-0042]